MTLQPLSVGVLALMMPISLACNRSGEDAVQVDADAADQVAEIPCPPSQRTTDGTCCPVGRFYRSETATCESVGPVN